MLRVFEKVPGFKEIRVLGFRLVELCFIKDSALKILFVILIDLGKITRLIREGTKALNVIFC